MSTLVKRHSDGAGRSNFPTSQIGHLGKEHHICFARNENEFLQALRLVYDEYCKQGYCPENALKLFYGPHTLTEECRVLNYMADGKVVATLSRVVDSDDMGLPMDSLYKDELEPLRKEGRKISECGSFASLQEKPYRMAAVELTQNIILDSIAEKISDICITVNPRHVNFYSKRYGFQVFGPEKHYAKVGAPAVPMRLDLHSYQRLADKATWKRAQGIKPGGKTSGVKFSGVVDRVLHLKENNVYHMCCRVRSSLSVQPYVPGPELISVLLDASPSLQEQLPDGYLTRLAS